MFTDPAAVRQASTYGADVRKSDADAIAASQNPWHLKVLESVDSTNEEIKRLINADEPLPCAVMAYKQEAGYGRQGRHWESPLGGLYLSCGYVSEMPLDRWSTLSLTTALAVVHALVAWEPELDASLALKWPNDVVTVQRDNTFAKLCGISLERSGAAICLGIGVNGRALPHRSFSRKASSSFYGPISLSQLTKSENRDRWNDDEWLRQELQNLAQAILNELTHYFARWEACGFEALVDEFNKRSVLTGRDITVSDLTGTTVLRGRACSVGTDGRLGLEDKNGQIHALSSGEVHILSA